MTKPLRSHIAWAIDARPLDAPVAGDRYYIAIVLDAGTRLIRGQRIATTAGAAVWGALDFALASWGAPRQIIADGGCELPEMMLEGLGVAIERVRPGSPGPMALVERALREAAR